MLAFSLLLLASLVSFSHGHGRSSANAQERFSLSSSPGSAAKPAIMAAEWSFVDCGEPTDAVELLSFEVSPDPPVPGKDLTIKVKGIAHTRIEEGAYADVVVKLGLIKLLTKQFDVCKEAAKANASVTCPVEEGEYKVTHTVQLPREIPPAKFVVSVRGYTADEHDMLCLDLNADFRPML